MNKLYYIYILIDTTSKSIKNMHNYEKINNSFLAGQQSKEAHYQHVGISDLSQLKDINEKALENLKVFSRFYLWALPLFDLGHVRIDGKMIYLSAEVSKRFVVSTNQNGVPRLLSGPAESQWLMDFPWFYAGYHISKNKLILVCKPEKPLSMCCIVLDYQDQPFGEKYMTSLHGQSHLILDNANPSGMVNKESRQPVVLQELNEEFFNKVKKQVKHPSA